MARLRSAVAPTPAKAESTTRRPILREKTNTTGTPAQAVETSMLALKNFKRRPRQGSMLDMVRQRRSSVAASLMNAQPQEEVEDTSVFDLGSASEGEDDFAPEAEGTPIQASKAARPRLERKSQSARKNVAATPATATPATKRNKRKSDEIDTSHSALDALRRKHRKSEVSHAEEHPAYAVEQDLEQDVHHSSQRQSSPVLDSITSDVQVVNSSPESTPPTEPSSSRKAPGNENADFAVPSTEEQERVQASHHDVEEGEEDDEDEMDTPNATMAEPASSSPVGSPIPETQTTDIYADPLTQVSPPPPEPARTRNKGSKKTAAMSTATLRALLPKRTLRPQTRARRTEYDISSDEEDEATAFDTTNLEDDEDELGGRMRRQTKASAQAKGNKKPTAASKAKPKTQTARKPSAPPPTKGKGKGKATRTYGRAATSDKENESHDSDTEQGGEDTSLSMREVAHSKELEEAKRKFAEVDNWDLSFESMSNEDHRSSSQNWR